MSTQPISSPPDRPVLVQRPKYVAVGHAEHFIVPLLQTHIQEMLSQFGQPHWSSNPRVLDVGCGRQPFRQELESLGYTYAGLDTQQNLENTVHFICAIDQELPHEVSSQAPFDFIFCTEVMEHVADWSVAFHNFSQLLVSGGRLLITCPHFYHLHEEPFDFWRPTTYALTHFGNKFGFKVLHQIQAGDAWDVLGTLLGSFSITPQTNQIRSKIYHLLIAGCRKLFVKMLRTHSIQKNLTVSGKIYLSNIVVFEKL